MLSEAFLRFYYRVNAIIVRMNVTVSHTIHGSAVDVVKAEQMV